jgi:hypothetical protein
MMLPILNVVFGSSQVKAWESLHLLFGRFDREIILNSTRLAHIRQIQGYQNGRMLLIRNCAIYLINRRQTMVTNRKEILPRNSLLFLCLLPDSLPQCLTE